MSPSLLHLNTMVIPTNRNSHITFLKTDLNVLLFPTVYALKLYEYACNLNKYEKKCNKHTMLSCQTSNLYIAQPNNYKNLHFRHVL